MGNRRGGMNVPADVAAKEADDIDVTKHVQKMLDESARLHKRKTTLSNLHAKYVAALTDGGVCVPHDLCHDTSSKVTSAVPRHEREQALLNLRIAWLEVANGHLETLLDKNPDVEPPRRQGRPNGSTKKMKREEYIYLGDARPKLHDAPLNDVDSDAPVYYAQPGGATVPPASSLRPAAAPASVLGAYNLEEAVKASALSNGAKNIILTSNDALDGTDFEIEQGPVDEIHPWDL